MLSAQRGEILFELAFTQTNIYETSRNYKRIRMRRQKLFQPIVLPHNYKVDLISL